MPAPITTNTLFYGDNLPILREHIADESVDLVYLDPPFNSNRSYNVLFKEESGKESAAQITAFGDTWHWDQVAQRTYQELVTEAPAHVGQMIGALRQFIGSNQMMAYLVMMAVRLVELHRVLKPTGSLYLHCDPTASHYLKIVLDTVFEANCFVNEVSWRRTTAKSDYRQGALNWPRVRDIILHYHKSAELMAVFNQPFAEYSEEYVAQFYRYRDPDGRAYALDNLAAPGAGTRGHPRYKFMGVTRYWRYSKEKMEQLLAQGRIVQTKPGAVPRYKRYLDEMPGVPITDDWDDIPPLQGQAREYMGYQTQKPVALLERIIQASSNPGDVVLDPFCGCGTAIAAAQKLGRRWIGIDITHLAISLIRYRLEDSFPGIKFKTVGEPEDLASARQLATENRYQFQWWALSLVRAKPLGGEVGSRTGKKGSDKGIDGVITFIDDPTGKPRRVLVQVKSGEHVSSGQIRDLVGVLSTEEAQIGVFVTLERPTADMEKAAVSAGFYHSPGWNRDYPQIQILTIEELLAGAEVQMPPAHGTFKEAPKVREEGEQMGMGI